MNIQIRTYFALKEFRKKRFFWSKLKTTIEVVSETRASSFLWAKSNLAYEGIKYDKLVLANPIT